MLSNQYCLSGNQHFASVSSSRNLILAQKFVFQVLVFWYLIYQVFLHIQFYKKYLSDQQYLQKTIIFDLYPHIRALRINFELNFYLILQNSSFQLCLQVKIYHIPSQDSYLDNRKLILLDYYLH